MPVSNNNYRDRTTIIYQLDQVKKTFRQYKRHSVIPIGTDDSLAEFLRIEKNNGYNTFTGFNNLLRLRDASNWSTCTRLGLKPTGTVNFYYINLIIANRKVLCIVYPKKSSTINDAVELHIFSKFYACEKSNFSEKVKELTRSIAHKKGI
jgi:hypothetical protein